MSVPSYKLKRLADNRDIALTPRMVIGRLEECELQLTASGSSRRHAVLTLEGDDLWLEDLKSANGTFINEQKLEGKAKLNAGDRFRIDVEEFLVEVPLEAAATVMKKFEPAALPPEAKPEPKKESAILKTDAVQVVENSNPAANLPGAWASGDNAGNDGEGRTAFIARKDLQGELESLGGAQLMQMKVEVPTLVVQNGIHAGMRFEMHPEQTSRAEWSIGSDPGRSVLLTDSGVSALHAVIAVEGSRWKLVDKMSANGTFVNGRSAPSIYLTPGDQIAFGPVKCAFLAPFIQQAEMPQIEVMNDAGSGKNRNLIIAAVSFGVTLLLLGLYLAMRK